MDPGELTGQPLNLLPFGIRPRRAQLCCRRAGATASAGSRHDRTATITSRAPWVPANRQLPKPEWSCAATSAAGEILPRAGQA
jgi:hypothetical protein